MSCWHHILQSGRFLEGASVLPHFSTPVAIITALNDPLVITTVCAPFTACRDGSMFLVKESPRQCEETSQFCRKQGRLRTCACHGRFAQGNMCAQNYTDVYSRTRAPKVASVILRFVRVIFVNISLKNCNAKNSPSVGPSKL